MLRYVEANLPSIGVCLQVWFSPSDKERRGKGGEALVCRQVKDSFPPLSVSDSVELRFGIESILSDKI